MGGKSILLRSLMLAIVATCFMTALATMPLAEATAIYFTAPLIMVALSVLAVSGLAKDEAGSASALFSMLRNLGGAVGTAGLTQIVAMRERFHSERVGESITLFSPSFQERLRASMADSEAFIFNQLLPAQQPL